MGTAGNTIGQREHDNGNTDSRARTGAPGEHPAWQSLIRFCREMGHGEIERLKIQDGLPVSAEIVRKKIRWL